MTFVDLRKRKCTDFIREFMKRKILYVIPKHVHELNVFSIARYVE